MTVEGMIALESLNQFSLTNDERIKAIEVFSVMDKEVEEFQNINTENVEIMVHCMPMINVLREDIHEQRFDRKALLAGAPEHSEDSWIVPRLVK